MFLIKITLTGPSESSCNVENSLFSTNMHAIISGNENYNTELSSILNL